MNSPAELLHYLGGAWTPSAGSDFLPVINPATNERLADVPKGTKEDVEAVVRAAAAAFPDGGALLPRTAFSISSS